MRTQDEYLAENLVGHVPKRRLAADEPFGFNILLLCSLWVLLVANDDIWLVVLSGIYTAI